jgi:hypothetical protein
LSTDGFGNLAPKTLGTGTNPWAAATFSAIVTAGFFRIRNWNNRTYKKAQVGLSVVDNTADANKSVNYTNYADYLHAHWWATT